MRGNVGFSHARARPGPPRVGEGITGEAVEYMRPIVAELAPSSTRPTSTSTSSARSASPCSSRSRMRGKSGPLGALVVQRAEAPFDGRGLELLAVARRASSPRASARGAHRRSARRRRRSARAPAAARARSRSPGGRSCPAARSAPSPRCDARPRAPSESAGSTGNHGEQTCAAPRPRSTSPRRRSAALVERAKAARARARRRVPRHVRRDPRRRALPRARARARGERSRASPQALGRVARDVTRTAASVTRDPFLEERARDIEDLCDALTMLAASDKRAELPRKAVLIGDALSVFDLLVSSRAHPVARRAQRARAAARARARCSSCSTSRPSSTCRASSAGPPTATSRSLDADHGLLVINPSKSEIACLREYKRSRPSVERTARKRSDPRHLNGA